MKIKCKDFEVKSFYTGNRLTNSKQYAYKIIYHSESGKSVEMDKVCFTKAEAKKYISNIVKIVSTMETK